MTVRTQLALRPLPLPFAAMQGLSIGRQGLKTPTVVAPSKRSAMITYASSLTGKEKRALRAFAHREAKAVPTCIVGDAGLTPAVVTSAADAIKTNELIRVKMAGIDKPDFKEAVEKVAVSLEAEVAGTVGRVALLYRRRSDGKGPIARQQILTASDQTPPAP